MATLKILAAFALSFAFMLFLWYLEDLLLMPPQLRWKPKLKIHKKPPNGAQTRQESAAEAERRNQNIRGDGHDGGKG